MTADDIKAPVERLRDAAKQYEGALDALGKSDMKTYSGFRARANHAHLAYLDAASPKSILEILSQVETLAQDIEDLKRDNASMLDSLTKESTARCEAEDALEALKAQNFDHESAIGALQ